MTQLLTHDEDELNQFKLSILEEFLPAECDIIGYRDLQLIVAHPVEMVASEFGSKLDHFQIYQAAIGFVGFINACVSIYKHLNVDQKKDKKQSAKIKQELIESKTITTIKEGDKIQVIEKVENHFKTYD